MVCALFGRLWGLGEFAQRAAPHTLARLPSSPSVRCAHKLLRCLSDRACHVQDARQMEPGGITGHQRVPTAVNLNP